MMKRRRKSAPPARMLTLEAQALGARADAVLPGPVYAPGLLPGETARLEVRGERGTVIERLSDSPDRVAPFCPVADRCGGCSLQHFERGAYRAWKQALVTEALSRAGVKGEVGALIDAHGEGRRRLTLHARRFGAKLAAGYGERAGDRIVEISDCPAASPALRAGLPGLCALAESAAPARGRIDIHAADCQPGLDVSVSGTGAITLAMRETAARLAVEYDWARVTIAGEPVIERASPVVRFGEVEVTPPPGGFLQATAQGEAALAAIVEEAAASLPGGAGKAADLYAGAGAFALRLARRMPVLAVEGEAAPLAALKRAAERTPGLKPVDARVRDLALEPLSVRELEGIALVVLDPPRAGARAQCERLADSAVPVLVLISCNPATFARDAAILIEGGYRMGPVSCIDQFAWTAHVECAAVFRRPA